MVMVTIVTLHNNIIILVWLFLQIISMVTIKWKLRNIVVHEIITIVTSINKDMHLLQLLPLFITKQVGLLIIL